MTDAHAIGAALACLHEAAAGYPAPSRQTRLIVASDALLHAPDLAAAITARLGHDAALRAALAGRPWQTDIQAALLPAHRALHPHIAALPPLWVHGDCHASNLLWQHGTVSAVLDFGLCNRASALYDLATAIERNAIAWLDLAPTRQEIAHPHLAHALLAGYQAVRPLPAAERAALPRMLPVVHVDFALSELAYFHAIARAPADADLAYAGFLLGHAAWFAGPAGRRLLHSLAEPA